MAKNCWEVKSCCRDTQEEGAAARPVCPAADKVEFDGLNRGKNGGRVCWFVAGTLCSGTKQGSFADKQLSCLSCDFYRLVKHEEGDDFRVKPPNGGGVNR